MSDPVDSEIVVIYERKGNFWKYIIEEIEGMCPSAQVESALLDIQDIIYTKR